jgi:hypothetical protein
LDLKKTFSATDKIPIPKLDPPPVVANAEEERMDMFEFFARQRFDNEKRRREALVY